MSKIKSLASAWNNKLVVFKQTWPVDEPTAGTYLLHSQTPKKSQVGVNNCESAFLCGTALKLTATTISFPRSREYRSKEGDEEDPYRIERGVHRQEPMQPRKLSISNLTQHHRPIEDLGPLLVRFRLADLQHKTNEAAFLMCSCNAALAMLCNDHVCVCTCMWQKHNWHLAQSFVREQ